MLKASMKIGLAALCGGALLCGGSAIAASPTASTAWSHIKHPRTHWARLNHKPLSDRAAAKLVTHIPENRPLNVPFNRYYVTKQDLRVFRTTKGSDHRTSLQKNPWNAYVTGRSFLHRPSTDDLIQWSAHKWGIPENWLRAQVAFEALWHMEWGGDLTVVPHSWYWRYPAQFRRAGWQVYESAGMAQIKWTPDNRVNVGTESLRWKSTAFNMDYLGATIRYYYDGKCSWCGRGYKAAEQWLSVGGWNRPKPWANSRQRWYIGQVQHSLRLKAWVQYQ
jgi:hypothetical protein